MDNKTIGTLIKNARLNNGYTQKELAERLGVTDKAISKWECGRSFPDITLIESISRELKLSVNQLVGVADNSKEKAIMVESIEKKIRIRLAIGIVIFSTIFLKIVIKLFCSNFTFWKFSMYLENIMFLVFISIGVACLVSSIILIYKRRTYSTKSIHENNM